ncbi:hypothetical protein [Cyanobium sp. Morenito 9A2]|uniref:hypothetical protein n=1 Tax=Cyanobium sp. Morenito 9A2 TaxID=2823718 RepID=UPI0020CC4163|nr:hypothetical protein [Cyanobium sp. Morenito 9A2]MCP9849656.1 hypothetical protein [Cyanobium sp. Morenito 9A2]
MTLLLLLVSVYMGAHWMVAHQQLPGGEEARAAWLVYGLYWPFQCLQTVLVVMVCTIPDLLLRQLSLLMSSSKVTTLVVTLLLVITGGLYLLHLNVLADVAILASAVLLARLDLARLRVVPPPLLGATTLSFLVLAGMGVGAHLQAENLIKAI